jgi:mannose-6-phosphate isomerase-like protein (cupin superfamily)
MPKQIATPVRIAAAGNMIKVIDEYVGRSATGTTELSIAHMRSPQGWSEPGQRPEFREYTLVLQGSLHVEFEGGSTDVGVGGALITEPGEWVRYSTPNPGGAEYIAVCLPAFSPASVHRDKT